MKNKIHFFLAFLRDERGEQTLGQPDGQGDASVATDEGASPEGGLGDGSGQVDDSTPSAPKYGEFGDNPTVDQVFEAFNKIKPDVDNYRGKLTAVERNLAMTRKALESHGIKILHDGDGNLRLLPAEEQQQTRKSRFTDEHAALFDKPVLEAVRGLVEDLLDSRFDSYDKQRKTMSEKQREFVSAQREANDKLVKLYPSIVQGSEGFNKNLYDLATEKWESKYRNLPHGELVAAHEAAIELGISPVSIANAKKEGFQQGILNKKIVSSVQTGGARTPGIKGNLSREEYLKLSTEDRRKYDEQNLKLGG